MKNIAVTLTTRPDGMLKESNFILKEIPLRALEDKEVLVKNAFISLDPAMRGWMNAGTTYIKGVEIGAPMRAFTVGQVIASAHPNFKTGEYVSGLLDAQNYTITNGERLSKVDENAGHLSLHLGVLGMPGMTAYFGLLEKGQPKAGETVFISGAAGIVGSTVGQIAKIKGCKVIGTAGSEQKCKYLTESCGFDIAINYKTEDVATVLKEICPEGVHVFYDNVGGELLDTVLANLDKGARVVICGAISQYNNKQMYGPRNYMKIVTARGYITGIIVFDFLDQYPRAVKDISTWLKEGKMKSKEHVIEGLSNFPAALKMLFTGDNFGKLLLKV